MRLKTSYILHCGTRLLLLSALLCAPGFAEKIRVHYDKSVDFSKYKTYGWAPHGAVAHPMLALDMVGAIEQELNSRGLQKVAANPDLLIEIYGAVDSEVSMTSNNPIYNATGNSAVRSEHDFAGRLTLLGRVLREFDSGGVSRAVDHRLGRL